MPASRAMAAASARVRTSSSARIELTRLRTVFSAVLAVLAAGPGAGVAGFPGMVGKLWMILTFGALGVRGTTANR
ncbi:MAG: hypothetical protein J2P22_16730 [Nocardioides sp.]|nr:hypothetical protein [Nocardioides sp.]